MFLKNDEIWFSVVHKGQLTDKIFTYNHERYDDALEYALNLFRHAGIKTIFISVNAQSPNGDSAFTGPVSIIRSGIEDTINERYKVPKVRG